MSSSSEQNGGDSTAAIREQPDHYTPTCPEHVAESPRAKDLSDTTNPCCETSNCTCALPGSSAQSTHNDGTLGANEPPSTESGSSEESSSDDEEDAISVTHLYRLMTSGSNPREVVKRLLDVPESEHAFLDECHDRDLWRLLFETVSKRQKLRQYNTLHDAVQLIKKSKKIIVLTGAGISVSCGIPDFRSPNGIYAQLKQEFPQLGDPSHMFNIHFFRNDPQPFFTFAKELYPGQFQPSVTHRFIKAIEDQGKLLRNYSQNIDTLETLCGINNVVLCHGSFAQATCLTCGHQVDADFIKADVLAGRIPKCIQCPEPGPLSIYKPNIVFFGEDLPAAYYQAVEVDKRDCDLLIVIGTSLKVHPVASIPRNIASVPQIVINREPVLDHLFDIELLGDADVITQQLSYMLDWKSHINQNFRPLHEISRDAAREQYRIARNPDPMTPEDFNTCILREMYESRNLGAWLPESRDAYMFVPPSRYIFPGALVLEKDREPGIRRLGDPFAASSSSSSSESEEESAERDRIAEKKEPSLMHQ